MGPEVSVVAEVPDADIDGVRLFVHPGWKAAMPELVQGITAGVDMSLFGAAPAREVTPRWLRLTDALGCDAAIHARQVHRADVLTHAVAVQGILIAGDADGHATTLPRTMLAVSVADCVPIAIAAPQHRAIALLHGGWRGVAAGILEAGMDVMRRRFAVDAGALHVHLGPAICGECFEVGPEVPPQLGIDGGAGPTPGHASRSPVIVAPSTGDRVRIDLRRHLAARAIAAGVTRRNVSVSAHCTRCGDSPFFSHRGGCAERQIAVLGWRGDSR